MRNRLAVISLAGVVLLLAGSTPAAAQDMGIGVKVGLNVAKFSLDENDFGLTEVKNRTGLLAGAFITRQIREGFGLQVEGLLTQKGAKLEGDDFDGPFDIDVMLNYIEIPVLARYNVPFGTGDSSVHVFGGPAFAFKVSDKQKFNDEELDEDLDQDLKGGDIGLTFGAGLEFQRFLVDVRYTLGLMNINDDDTFDDPDDLPVKNRVFSVSVGYRFR